MEILTYPIGLVIGVLPVIANLGPAGGPPAQLFLDGRPACTMTDEAPRCPVDLGREVRVHELELVRRNTQGDVVERAVRWVNRPGAQAEVYLRGACDDVTRACTVSVGWGHPAKLDPRAMTVTLNGRVIERKVVHEVHFHAKRDTAMVVSVDVIFPDARRASQTRLFGVAGFAGVTEAAMQAVPIVMAKHSQPPRTLGGFPVRGIEDAPEEVAFVVEPLALEALRGLWTRSHAEMRVPGAPLGEEVNGELADLEAMTVIIPNEHLNRFEVFNVPGGRDAWLPRMALGADVLEGRGMRLADAVASAGQLVAGALRKRAVVLVVSGRHPDQSLFSAAQAVAYLREIMVPLVVWRMEKDIAPEWPAGPRVTSRSVWAAAKALRATLDSQRIAWVESDAAPDALHPDAPGVLLAGRPAVTTASVTSAMEEIPREAPAPAPTAPKAPPASAFAERVNVTAVRVLVRPRPAAGHTPPVVRAADVEVLEDGQPATVIGLQPLLTVSAPSSGPAATEPPGVESATLGVTVYLAPDLSTRGGFGRTLGRLRRDAQRLVALGPVGVVLANPEPRTLADGVTDAATLVKALDASSVPRLGSARLTAIRRRFLELMGPGTVVFQAQEGPAVHAGLDFRGLVGQARAAVREEEGVVRSALGRLVAWARGNRGAGGRLLFLVLDGFDLDAGRFYLDQLEPLVGDDHDRRSLFEAARAEFQGMRLDRLVSEASAALCARGWAAVLFYNGVAEGAAFGTGAEMSGYAAFQRHMSAPAPGATSAPLFAFERPREALADVADATGGVVVPPGGSLDAPLTLLARTWVLTYQVERPADGQAHRVEVRSRVPGLEFAAPHLIFSGTSEAEAEARARRVLSGTEAHGELPVSITVAPQPVNGRGGGSGTLAVRVDLESIREALLSLGSVRIRVTVAVSIEGAEPFVTHDVQQVASSPDGSVWSYEAPIAWPAGARRCAVIVEELATGAWGGAVIDLPRAK
jgi:hypothetical protein